MKMEKVRDERVVEQHRKIASGAYQLVSIFLLISIVYKQFILNEPFKEYMTEFIAFFGGALYVVLGNIMKGNYVATGNTTRIKKPILRWCLIYSLVSSSTITFVLVIQNRTRYSQNQVEIIIMFLSIFIFSLLLSLGLGFLAEKRSEKITKQNETEDDN